MPRIVDGVEQIEGKSLTLLYEGKKCIHARFCVTGAPKVFLANVNGPWINPDALPVESLVEIAHDCPSGAIRYRRTDGKQDEAPPPVNLLRFARLVPTRCEPSSSSQVAREPAVRLCADAERPRTNPIVTARTIKSASSRLGSRPRLKPTCSTFAMALS
ncbi:MAG TPA: (4Fe-4S)-binding protein [Polyangiaceae bacterium]|nr:(4Fe-4S)-binding protein [Polyangiaceae bacterium]